MDLNYSQIFSLRHVLCCCFSKDFWILVPVVFSKISPDTTPLTEKENNTVSLECISSSCRPQARFFWYKNNKNETSGNEVILKEIMDTAPSSDLQPYNNVYNITLTRDLNDWFLFCASDNRNSTPVPSSMILLDVTCKYTMLLHVIVKQNRWKGRFLKSLNTRNMKIL